MQGGGGGGGGGGHQCYQACEQESKQSVVKGVRVSAGLHCLGCALIAST
jgi:hypothetical protein